MPSHLVGRPLAAVLWLERRESEHADCASFATPALARAEYKWRVALHFAAKPKQKINALNSRMQSALLS